VVSSSKFKVQSFKVQGSKGSGLGRVQNWRVSSNPQPTIRNPQFGSLISQRHHRIDFGGPTRWNVARQERNTTQQGGNAHKSKRVKRAKPEKQSSKEPGGRRRSGESYRHAQRYRPHALAQNQPHYVSSSCSQRHTDADLVRA